MQSSSIRFATAVQALARTARAQGLVVPGFRSPPRLRGVHRSIKRWDGGATIAVVVRDRPWVAVQADLVEGVIAANRLAGPAADLVRDSLWLALEGATDVAEPAPASERRRSAASSKAEAQARPSLRAVPVREHRPEAA